MKLYEVIQSLNSDKSVVDYANEFGVSRKTVTERLKKIGYIYENNSKTYIYTGDPKLKKEVDNQEFIIKKKVINSSKSNNKSLKKSDKNQIKEVEKDDDSLTKEEVKFLKEMLKNRSNMSLVIDFTMLPPKGKDTTKKHTLEISQETWDRFSEFSENWKEKRLSKNDLIEIAIRRLMRDI